MSNYKVSLIIPCYNINNIATENDNAFELTVTSIINQSFGVENIETIFVDDCSNDGTQRILTNLSKEYPSFKTIFLKKNSGKPSIPRNIGIKNASAEYIMFLDQDDQMDVYCVEKLYDEVVKNNVDIVKSNYSILMGEKILKYDSGKNIRLSIKPKSKDMIYVISHFIWGSIYNKDFLIKNEIFFPDMQAEDNLFLSKCFNLTEKNIISLNNYYSVIYSSNNVNSLAHTFTLQQVLDYEEIFEKTVDDYINYNQSYEYIQVTIQRYILVLIGSLLRSKVSLEEKKVMIKTIKKFLLKYEEYPVHLSVPWKLFYKLILNEFSLIIHFSSLFILKVFENRIFKKIFRNQDYS